MAYENKNLAGMGYDPYAFDVATYLELTPIVSLEAGLPIQQEQRERYIDYLTSSPDSEVKRLEVRTTDLGHLGLSNVVEALDEGAALRTVVANVSRALRQARLDLGDFSFVAAHAVLDEQLLIDGQAAKKKGLPWSISHMQYMMDPDVAYDIFTTTRVNAQDFDLNTLLADIEQLTANS